jgi:AcrR family transcriptional regulator
MAAVTRNLRQKHVEETRTRIRDAALELIAEQGFAATTIDAIAARADVAPRTFFRHFPTKEAVFFDGAGRRFGQVVELIASRPDGGSSFDALAATLADVLAEIERDPTMRQLARTLAPEVPYLRTQRPPLADDLEREIVALLATREGRPPDDLALRAVVAAVSACFTTAIWSWVEHAARGSLGANFDDALSACAQAFSSQRVGTR